MKYLMLMVCCLWLSGCASMGALMQGAGQGGMRAGQYQAPQNQYGVNTDFSNTAKPIQNTQPQVNCQKNRIGSSSFINCY